MIIHGAGQLKKINGSDAVLKKRRKREEEKGGGKKGAVPFKGLLIRM